VHKDVICVKSKFFRAACSDGWQEGQEKVVRLPEARSIQAFQMYMDWTYTNDLVLEDEASGTGDDYIVNGLIELYLLGDVLNDVRLRNKALRSITAEMKRLRIFLNPGQCDLIWEHTSTNSSIRKCMVDHLVSLLAPQVFHQYAEKYPADLVLRTARVLMDRYVKYRLGDKQALEARVESYMEPEGHT
jgi:hypothetical protein